MASQKFSIGAFGIKLISLRDSRRGTSRLRGLEAREIWARDQIGNGIIEFWVDAESEMFDFRGLVHFWWHPWSSMGIHGHHWLRRHLPQSQHTSHTEYAIVASSDFHLFFDERPAFLVRRYRGAQRRPIALQINAFQTPVSHKGPAD